MAAGGKRRHGLLGLPDLKRASGLQENPAKATKISRTCPICRLECGSQADLLTHFFVAKSPGFKNGDKVYCVGDPSKRGRVMQVDTDHNLMTVRLKFDGGSHEDRRVRIWLLDETRGRARYFWMLDEEAAKKAVG